MSTASGQELSHADRHDLDKLTRWKAGLDGAAEDGTPLFPVCAIFLVGPEHRASHDIFRRYRSVFEELGGGFHHLVIFGQHGVSTTQTAFLAELGMEQRNVPVVALADMSNEGSGAAMVWRLELPKGEQDGELDESQSWGAVLEAVRGAASGKSELSLAGVAGVEATALRRGVLSAAVEGVLEELGGD